MLLTIKSAGRVLDLYTVDQPEWGVTETARALGLTRSKAHALLASLAAIGILRRVPGGRYRVGWRTLALSRIVSVTTERRAPALHAGRRLVHTFGETVHIATLDGGRVLYVDRVTAPDSLRLATTTRGSAMPAHCSGLGKVLLAGLDDDEADDTLSRQGLPALTPTTITDSGALRHTLGEVRRRGYACDRDEALTGVSCVAAPVRDAGGRTVAALSISAPSERLSRREDELRRAVVGAARAASLHRA